MKNYLFTLFVILSSLNGCDLVKVTSVSVPEEEVEVTFNFQINPSTRSYTAVIGNEYEIDNICCYIFDTDSGKLLSNYSTSGEVTSHTVSLPMRNIMVYAFANVYEDYFTGIIDLRDFNNALVGWEYLVDNGYFPLISKTTLLLNGETTVNMQMEQMMSRIYFTRIDNTFDKDINLKYAFLSNVQGASYVDISKQTNTNMWFSLFGRNGDSEDDIITPSNLPVISDYNFLNFNGFSLGISKHITPKTPFYTFPNYSENDMTGWEMGDEYDERFTRLVLVAEIEGVDYYYPVNLVGIRAGYSYNVNITISRLGSDDPDTFDFVEYEDITIEFGGMDDVFIDIFW